MWEDNVRKVIPYTAGEQPKGKVIKLNTNEFPYAPSPMVATRIYDLAQDELEGSSSMLRKYPDMDAVKLVNAIVKVYNERYFADSEGLGFDNVFTGVGSDDVLSMAFMTFFNSDKPVLFPDITYSFYDVWAKLHRIPYKTQALREDFTIDLNDYLYKENGGIVIPNPNAPTGIAEPVGFFEDIISRNRESIVIIDEAYVDFGAQSCIKLLDKYNNLIVVRTFSKSRSMAGSRIGYALASKEIIRALHNVKYSYNSYTMDSVTIKLGIEAMKDEKYFRENLDKVICTRNWTYNKLTEMGFEVYESCANFLFVKPSRISAKELFDRLKERNIYVRYFNKPRIDNYLRISIGTDEEMRSLIAAIENK